MLKILKGTAPDQIKFYGDFAMADPTEVRPNSLPDRAGDNVAILIGCVSGALSGVSLGLLIAWTISPDWTIMSWIVLFHITLAMIAMGAWCAPSLFSDPENDGPTTKRVVPSQDELNTIAPSFDVDNYAQSLEKSGNTAV